MPNNFIEKTNWERIEYCSSTWIQAVCFFNIYSSRTEERFLQNVTLISKIVLSFNVPRLEMVDVFVQQHNSVIFNFVALFVVQGGNQALLITKPILDLVAMDFFKMMFAFNANRVQLLPMMQLFSLIRQARILVSKPMI